MLIRRKITRFGWFLGVFIPTFLTIIGVIYYLRLGSIVGELGVVSTIAIIFIAESVVMATALSIVGISKHKSGPGGAIALINNTLGENVARVIGVPLFLAQTFSLAFYIFGFSEVWGYAFPSHSSLVVSLLTLLVLFLLTYTNITTAVRAEIVIFGLILLSLASIFLGGSELTYTVSEHVSVTSSAFWQAFALFFPAVTGIMAGIGLSGQLNDPKHAIAKGTYTAIAVTMVIYLLTAIWLGLAASPVELMSNNLILIDVSLVPRLVVIGILGATFSSGLVTLIAASRLLQTLSTHSYVPFSRIFVRRKQGEPRNAIMLISVITVGLLLIGSLNTIALLLTIFFLLTYGVINYGYYKKYCRTISSKTIAAYGTVSVIIIIILINPLLGALSMLLMVSGYYLVRRYHVRVMN